MTSAVPAPPRAESDDGAAGVDTGTDTQSRADADADTDADALTAAAHPIRTGWTVLPARMVALSIVELQKIRHDRSEIYSRAVTPLLWLAVFGETFTRIHAIPTGRTPYLAYLSPGIIAQSAMFIAIFYGIQIIWERDAGVLTKLMVTPTPAPPSSPPRPSPPAPRPWSRPWWY
nr:ABC transporter permease [Actinospica durhamensis]